MNKREAVSVKGKVKEVVLDSSLHSSLEQEVLVLKLPKYSSTTRTEVSTWRSTIFFTFAFVLFTFIFLTPVYAQGEPPEGSEGAKIVTSATQPTREFNCSNYPHECAVMKQNKLLLPTQVEGSIKPAEQGIFSGIQNMFDMILMLFGFQIASKEEFASRVDIQHQAELPEQVKAKQGNILENTAQNIGNRTKTEGVGIYPKNIAPQAQEGLTKSCELEELYEQSYFPSGIGINPVTGNGCKK